MRLLAITLLAITLALTQVGSTAAAPQVQFVRISISLPTPPQAADEAYIASLGGIPRNKLVTSNTITADVPASIVPALQKNARFLTITLVPTIKSLEDQLDWGVDRVDGEVVWGGAENALNVTNNSVNAGQGVKVAVIDTGLVKTHPDLQANIAGGRNWVPSTQPCGVFRPCQVSTSAWDDNNGHGTHVAGTIGAVDNGTGMIGIAPRVSLYGLKVLGANGSGNMDDAAAAVEWAAGLSAGGIKMDVINMSFGSGSPYAPLQSAVDAAYAAGVLVVAAAGNNGSGVDTVDYPAHYNSVIAVAATCGPVNSGYCSGLDTRASFSSTGTKVELSGPGDGIKSDWLSGGTNTISGTSMATPHVVGVAALVKQANPGMSPLALRALLGATAIDLGTPGRDNSFGFGLVNAVAALGGSPPPIDNVAPQVQSVTPLNNATNVAVSVSPTATFNEPMSQASINTTSFTLTRNSNSSAVTGNVSYVGNTATFDPVSNLMPSESYTARITTVAEDVAGNHLATTFVWSFTTASGGPPPTSCTAPQIQTQTDSNGSGGGSVSFTWAAVSGATQYTVQRQSILGAWSTITTTASTSFNGSDGFNDPNWRVYVSGGTCSPLPGPMTTFDP